MDGGKRLFFDYPLSKLEKAVVEEGEKPYRARQLFEWVYKKRVYDPELMTDVSKSYRERLAAAFSFALPEIATKQEASDGTVKFLLRMADLSLVEAVLMRYDYGNVACVSSEVGCSMGCAFCASGLLKRTRVLTAGEIVSECLLIDDFLKEAGERLSHVVVMGTGEPFDNYDNVMDFIRIINDDHAMGIGARHITVSTCGILDKIRRYGKEGLQINLAISLHASNEKTRRELMPIARGYTMEELMDACRDYIESSGRRLTFEYILIDGLNDKDENAYELASLLKGMLCYVNLIPLNPVKEKPFKRSKNARRFMTILNNRGINCTVRKEFGTDIDAACGQLRAKYQKAK